MASTFSTNLHLELQGTGEHSGTWGATLNTASLNIVDQALGGAKTVSLSASDVTLNTADSQNNCFILSGTLTANVSVIWPSIGRTIFVTNNTTGNFTVTLKTASAGATVTIEQGSASVYTLNVTDVYAVTILHLLKSNTSTTLTVGYPVTSYSGGTISSGTYTPAAANGNFQFITNNGAFTMAAPAADCAINILVTNGASAGAITISGYSVGTNTGDTYATTNANKYIFQIVRINSVSTYAWKALQ